MKEETVKLIECPRDAWQGLPHQIPTAQKVEYLRALIAAGFRHLDAVSFVSPKAVPQMADSEAVLAQLESTDDIEIIGIVVNEKGAERAIATGKVTTLGFPFSISPTFLQRNQNQSPNETVAVLRRIKEQADAAGRSLVVYISMAFGNPYGDCWSEARVVDAVQDLMSSGIDAISLADTAGAAAAEKISAVVRQVITAGAGREIGVHLHSRSEAAGAKVLAAYDAGCRRFDSALGGLGGCPFAQDELVGNIPTEEVLRALRLRGVEQPLALDAATILNEQIRSRFGL